MKRRGFLKGLFAIPLAGKAIAETAMEEERPAYYGRLHEEVGETEDYYDSLVVSCGASVYTCGATFVSN